MLIPLLPLWKLGSRKRCCFLKTKPFSSWALFLRWGNMSDLLLERTIILKIKVNFRSFCQCSHFWVSLRCWRLSFFWVFNFFFILTPVFQKGLSKPLARIFSPETQRVREFYTESVFHLSSFAELCLGLRFNHQLRGLVFFPCNIFEHKWNERFVMACC